MNIFFSSSLPHVAEIHRAVEYFYGDASPEGNFPRHTGPLLSGGTRIIANSGPYIDRYGVPNNLIKGGFSGSTFEIIIFNAGDDSGNIIGTTLHELGHLVHCRGDYFNNYNGFNSTILMLKESAASYVGWYLGEEYYMSQGRTQYSDGLDITGQGRQEWMEYWDHPYTPLFIDLSDEYNQGLFHDTFTEWDPVNVWNIVTNCRTWAECKQYIEYNAVTWRVEIDDYLDYYDSWFTIYPNYLTQLWP